MWYNIITVAMTSLQLHCPTNNGQFKLNKQAVKVEMNGRAIWFFCHFAFFFVFLCLPVFLTPVAPTFLHHTVSGPALGPHLIKTNRDPLNTTHLYHRIHDTFAVFSKWCLFYLLLDHLLVIYHITTHPRFHLSTQQSTLPPYKLLITCFCSLKKYTTHAQFPSPLLTFFLRSSRMAWYLL